jgi:hypothetical protein
MMSHFSLLSTAYAPPPIYFRQLKIQENSRIEAHENYQKQSFRNRCIILSSSGLQSLSIPIKHGKSLLIRDIEIETKEQWQKKHWKSIQTCYGTSPYFIFYRDYFEQRFTKSDRFLFDWNFEILTIFCSIFKIEPPIFTDNWQPETQDAIDFRNTIHPKKQIDNSVKIYPSTFNVNSSNQAYLSSFDLLFNLGPDSSNHLFL